MKIKMKDIFSESRARQINFYVAIGILICCMGYSTVKGEFGRDTLIIAILWLLVIVAISLCYLCLRSDSVDDIQNC